MNNYIEATSFQFQYYKDLAEKAISPLTIEELSWSPGGNSNSIQTVMRHIAGNIKSRWTDFLTTDGEKEWRKRDTEFSHSFDTKEELLLYWEECWKVLFRELHKLSAEDLELTVYIRSEPHTAIKAIQRQLAHAAYHIGQVIYLAKLIQGDDWSSLSIPLGGSDEFNRERMG